MNSGIIYAFRNSEGIFVSIYCYILLGEKLSPIKLTGVIVLVGGVCVLGYACAYNNVGNFSLLAAMLSLGAAVTSAGRNYAVKKLTKLEIRGEDITIFSVGISDLLCCIIAAFLSIFGYGFNYDTPYGPTMSWDRFGLATIVGAGLFWGLTTIAMAI